MASPAASPPWLAAEYFDGVSARAHAVQAGIEADQLCLVHEATGTRQAVPLRAVQWPERQRHGARVARLPDGATLHCADAPAYDTWARHHGLPESWVVKAQQSWRWTLAGALAVLLLAAAFYQWGLPLTARAALAFVPAQVDRELGDVALRSFTEQDWLAPSELPLAQQQRLRNAWASAAARAGNATAPIELHFHQSRLGANAFALPGGHVVLTDAMVTLLEGRDDVLIGVLAHEAGHVRHRHGMRAVAQTALLGSLSAVVLGDFSSVLAAAPALLGQLAYSRDFEREADDDAIALLQANGLSPELMVTLFERLEARRRAPREAPLPIALGSHPPDAERIARFRQAALR